MRKIGIIAFSLLLASNWLLATLYDDATNELSDVFTKGTRQVNTVMIPHMGFYGASGNIVPITEHPFPGFNVGIGIGLSFDATLLDLLNHPELLNSGSSSSNAAAFDTISQYLGKVILPFDMVYAKLDIPFLDLDGGVRFGYLPTFDFASLVGMPSGSALKVDLLHFGGEARWKFFELPGGFLKLDARLSVDYDQGSMTADQKMSQSIYASGVVVGTNDFTYTLKYSWSGWSIAPKVFADISLFSILDVYAGLGLDWNFGQGTANMSAGGYVNMTVGGSTPINLAVQNLANYNPIDIRAVVGVKVFFVNVAAEYGFMSKNFAITLVPLSIGF